MKQSTLEHELAVEQAHVDLVYSRLEEATRSAQQVADQGADLYKSDRGSFVREEDGTGLYERDVFAFQAARRLAVLDAEHEGLVFGRLDRTDGDVRYVGRIGVRDADYEPLVIDWRARAAEPFYRATPSNPMDVVRRRVLRCSGNRVVGIEDDLLDSAAAEDELVVMLSGRAMLVEDDGEREVAAGDVLAWAKGSTNGHHLINRSDQPCSFVAIGRPNASDCHYPDAAMRLDHATGEYRPLSGG